jgi:hypothetical protein
MNVRREKHQEPKFDRMRRIVRIGRISPHGASWLPLAIAPVCS